MAKVTIQQIEDAGFRAAQFGTPPDWSTAGTGYLARVIAAAEAWLVAEVGAETYAVTAGFIGHALAQAELCWGKAELWKRRAAFLDANAQSSLDQRSYLERREYLAHGDAAMQCALDWLASARAGTNTAAGGGYALAYIESGPFPEAAV
jgi:hypothetical protein